MLIDAARGTHLAYCTNIHAAEGWTQVFANIKQYAPALKQRLSADAPFAIGLRLSAQEAEQLLWGKRLTEFARFLEAEGLYVFTVNGFAYGSFHRSHVKAAAFAPDWQSGARVDYTLRLAEILAALLPDNGEGGISTVPLSYKPWIAHADFDAWQQITLNIVRVCGELARLRARSGKLIHIDLEPAPDGLIETGAETVAFFNNWLLPLGIPTLAQRLGISLHEARLALLDHVRVCFDTCHMAVEYEDMRAVLAGFADTGIQVGKLRLNTNIGSTHDDTRAMLGLLHTQGFTRHVEIETYTWEVLPAPLKHDLLDSLEREYRWALDALAPPLQPSPLPEPKSGTAIIPADMYYAPHGAM